MDANDDLDAVPELAGLVEESNDERKSARKVFFPSSIWLSFLVAGTCRELAVTVRWSDYAAADMMEADGARHSVWPRTSREGPVDPARRQGGTGRAADVPSSYVAPRYAQRNWGVVQGAFATPFGRRRRRHTRHRHILLYS